MRNDDFTAAEQAEILRKKQLYRDLIRSGKIRLAPDRAARLLGPDCLFHLYGSWVPAAPRTRLRTKSARVEIG
jgi:hypothetical protein